MTTCWPICVSAASYEPTLMTTTPMDGVAALQRASALCDLGRWDDAAGRLRAILATDPHNEDGLCLMAQARLGQKAYDESLRMSLTAISVNPENEWPHRIASLALFELRRHEEARAMGRDAIRLAPNLAAGHINLARMLAESDADLGEARYAADRAVFLAPNDPDSHIAVGVVAIAAGRKEEAVAALERALALDPDNHVAHNELARLRLMTTQLGNAGGLAQAAGGFAAALRANPRADVSRFNLDLVLHLSLVRIAYAIFLVAFVALRVSQYSDAALARVLPVLLLAFPAVFAARFVNGLEPQLRDYLRQALRNPFIASAVLCDAVAAMGLVVGAAFQRASTVAFGCALAFSVLARLILWQQTRSRFGIRGKVPRYVWWIAAAVLIVLTQLAFGPLPAVMSSTEVVLRVSAAIGSVAVVYAIRRRRK